MSTTGNGKTISIKALMHSLSTISSSFGRDIPALYVKSAPRTYDIRSIFLQARAMAPCMLILEDIDTIVTRSSRSYFFNEVDGLENNDGIFMVASTNHLDQLDPGLSSRPSRFDRKYLFPLPSEHERTLYCEYWRNKLKSKPAIRFPRKLCPAIAAITAEFSFAYLQELFIATLLAIAGHRSEDHLNGQGGGDEDEDDGGDLDHYELWTEIKKQAKALRDDMGTQDSSTASSTAATDIPETSINSVGPIVNEVNKGVANPREAALAFRSKLSTSPRKGPAEDCVLHQRGLHNMEPMRFDREGNSTAGTLIGKQGGPRDLHLFAADETLVQVPMELL